MIGEEKGSSQNDASEIKTESESEIRPLPLAAPNEETSTKENESEIRSLPLATPKEETSTKENESEIRSLPLATPNEETSTKTPLEKSASQKSRKRPMGPPISKSLTNVMAVSKSSASDQPSAMQSFLDQLLTEQTRMFDRTGRKQSPQLGSAFTISPALSVPPSAMSVVSSETRQPAEGLLDGRAVIGPTSAMGDPAQQHSTRKAATLADAGSYGSRFIRLV